MRGELPKALELAEHFLRLAQREQDSARLMGAYSVLGQTLFYLGEFAAARGYLEQGMALDDPTQDRSAALRLSGQIQGVVYRRSTALTLGQETERMAQIHQDMDAQHTMGAELMVPYRLALLAEAYGRIGQTAEGLRILPQALALAH